MISSPLVLGAVWGMLLGLFYFGSLWFTVRKVHRVGRPYWYLLTSFIVRSAVTLLGFWLVLQHDPLQWFSALLFFILPRLVIAALLRRPDRGDSYANQP